MQNDETGAPELKPTMQVYRALVGVVAADFSSQSGIDAFMDDALVLLPECTRAELLAMDFGALTLAVRERVAQVAPLFAARADVTTSIAQADDLVNGA